MTTVEKLVPMVKRIAGRFRPVVYGTADREDLVQEGYVGLLEAASRYEPGRGCSLSTWGARRANGAMLDHIRTLSRRSRERPVDAPTQRQEYAWHCASEHRSPESREMLIRFGRFMRRAWKDLQGPLRDVIRMRFLEGASVRETARSLGCSAATVVRREKKAIQELREGYRSSGYGRE